MSIRGEKRAFTLFLLIVLLVVPAYAYYDHQTRPATGAWSMVGDLQFRATSVQATGLGFGGPDLQLTVVVNNPNGFGVSLTSANYSIYADGRHLLDGHVAQEYTLTPQSTQTLVFPISIGWGSTFQTLGDYIWMGGNVAWEAKGMASIEVGGIFLAVPFDLSIHTG